MYRYLLLATGAALAALPWFSTSATSHAAVAVTVEAAWIREGPPVMTNVAGYMVLNNRGDRTEAISSARSADFERIGFHRVSTVDGVARMHPQSNIEIPPSGQTVLEPGGMHLMLLGSVRPLRAGDEVEIVFMLESGKELSVTFPVRTEAPR